MLESSLFCGCCLQEFSPEAIASVVQTLAISVATAELAQVIATALTESRLFFLAKPNFTTTKEVSKRPSVEDLSLKTLSHPSTDSAISATL